MNRYNLLSAFALLLLILIFPFYAGREPARMQRAQEALRAQQLDEGVLVYVDYCARCHGPAGAGSAAMPALNNPALAESDPAYLYATIARAPHGSVMSAWHIAEGGILNDYQVDRLVTLIRYADWKLVAEKVQERGVIFEEIAGIEGNPLVAARNRYSAVLGQTADPHQCVACHEEPALHANRFGLDCVRCHSLAAWQPALLTRHTFELDHGGEGQVPCQSCHKENYAEHTCYGCHDHTPEGMADAHVQEGIDDYAACVSCHPTGREGEGRLATDQEAYSR